MSGEPRSQPRAEHRAAEPRSQPHGRPRSGRPSTWVQAALVYRQPRMLSMLFLGFSSGLPFYLVYQTLSAWLRQEGILPATIGMLAWASVAYPLKFLWAPVVDRLHLPLLHNWLGRRRSWMLVAQFGVGGGLLILSASHPSKDLLHVVAGSACLAFFSATQDIAIDAWRIESAPDDLQGAMAAAYQLGYTVALIAGGAGALGLAQGYGWEASYWAMSALGAVGVVTTLLTREPRPSAERASALSEARAVAWLERNAHWPRALRHAGANFIGAVVCPLLDFFGRRGAGATILILLLVGSYHFTDYAMASMINSFYIDHGYSLEQIATVVKLLGLSIGLAGVLIAGAVIAELGIYRGMVLGSVLMAASNLGFAMLASTRGPTLLGLALANTLSNLAIPMQGTALIAYMSSLTSVKYTATQYALFSSFYIFAGKLLEGTSGFVVTAVGYPSFFVYTASLSVPPLVLLFLLSRWYRREAFS